MSPVAIATKMATTRWACCSNAGARKLQICQRMTGSASRKPAASEILNEVKNGSVTPSVTSCVFVGQRLHEPLEDLLVERERDRHPAEEREEADEHPRAQLVEMLHERGALAVLEATRQTCHGSGLARVGDALGLGGSLGGSGGAAGAAEPRRAGTSAGGSLFAAGSSSSAGDGLLELPHPAAERAAHLGQPLRPEEHEQDHERR